MLRNRLFQISSDTGPSGSGLTLDYQGRGSTTSTGAVTMNYGDVDNGSAPSAGDLVVYSVVGYTGTITTPSGWTLLGSQSGGFLQHAYYIKIITGSDISSPPTPITSTTYSVGIWIAARPSGSITIRTTDYASVAETDTDPASVNLNETAETGPGIMFSSHGSFASTITSDSWSGATADGEISDAITSKATVCLLTRYKIYSSTSTSGDSITADMGDEGDANKNAIGAVWVE